MEEVLIYILILLLSFSFYHFLILRSDKKLKKYKDSTEVLYLKTKYNLKIEKIDFKKLAYLLAISNSFIISTIVMIAGLFESIIIKILISFILIFPMIISIYHLIGTYYAKVREGK